MTEKDIQQLSPLKENPPSLTAPPQNYEIKSLAKEKEKQSLLKKIKRIGTRLFRT
jgi:hypothetical protein